MNFWNRKFSLSLTTALVLTSSLAFAEEIKTNTAVIQAMDKVTGRVQVINVPVNGNVDFGTFSIVVRDCQTRPPEETPENFAFVDIVDNNIDGTKENIFRGWMMSSTPALNAVEHPIYDAWLLKCIDTTIDNSRLLSAEDLEARNSIPKKVVEETKLKEDVPQELIDATDETPLVTSPEALATTDVETTSEITVDTTATQDTTQVETLAEDVFQEATSQENPSQEVPAQQQELKPEQSGVLDSTLVVKGLVLDNPVSATTEAPVGENTPQQLIDNDANSPTSIETQDQGDTDDFYDEFDSLTEQ
ncbi:MAG: DUF2155 domain-containing protein [Alphaproteobacteria bacterium]